MKKAYSKPDIQFESFTLSTNIAYSCEEEPNTNTEGCGIRAGAYIIFTGQPADDCTRSYKLTQYNQYCYHVPESDLNIFNVS